MSDLHEFPYFESTENGFSVSELQQKILEQLQCKVIWKEDLLPVKHSFTRFRVRLTPHLFACSQMVDVEGYEWFSLAKLKELAFSSGHRRILNNLIVV